MCGAFYNKQVHYKYSLLQSNKWRKSSGFPSPTLLRKPPTLCAKCRAFLWQWEVYCSALFQTLPFIVTFYDNYPDKGTLCLENLLWLLLQLTIRSVTVRCIFLIWPTKILVLMYSTPNALPLSNFVNVQYACNMCVILL